MESCKDVIDVSHNWGEQGIDWHGIEDSAYYIDETLKKYGRICVMDSKEKYGTVRVYCTLGWCSLHCIVYPGYMFSQFPGWLWRLDCDICGLVCRVLNILAMPYHKWLYRHVYSNAVDRWPHLRNEILCCADFPELLEGL